MPSADTLERFIAQVESNGERIVREQFFYDPAQLANESAAHTP